MLTRLELIPTRRSTEGWSGPKDQKNKTDKFLSAFGIMYVIVNSTKRQGQGAQRPHPEKHRTT